MDDAVLLLNYVLNRLRPFQNIGFKVKREQYDILLSIEKDLERVRHIVIQMQKEREEGARKASVNLCQTSGEAGL